MKKRKHAENDSNLYLEYEDTFRVIEGTLAYVNMPMANSFLNILNEKTGKVVSIAFGLILKIEWDTMPKWTQLSEEQVVDSATMRLKNLDNELEIQRNNMAQQEALSEMLDKSGVSESS